MAKTNEWLRRFDEPIVLPDGKKLVTLRDAIRHLRKTLSKRERNTAVTVLTYAAKGPNVMMMNAHIAVVLALNWNSEGNDR